MSDDVISCAAAAAGDAAALDADDGIADAIAGDAMWHCHDVHHDDDDCVPWVAMACCGHCVANATSAARLPDGHDGAAHDLAMPPSALAVCESQIEP